MPSQTRALSLAATATVFFALGWGAAMLGGEPSSAPSGSATQPLAVSQRPTVPPPPSPSSAATPPLSSAATAVPSSEPSSAAAAKPDAAAQAAMLAAGLNELLKQPKYRQLSEIQRLVGTDPESAISQVADLVASVDPEALVGGWGLAEAAILALVPAQSAAVDTALYQYVDSGEPMLAVPAARALAERGDTRALDAFLAKVAPDLDSADADQRLRAVVSVGRAKSERALPYLAKAAEDPSSAVRLRAAQALAYVRSEAAIPLTRKLLNDENSQVREAADQALARQVGA